MPGRSPDALVKRFELRVGVGGLPSLGGMFRSGDPVTIPPHKFHLLVNMRRTPGGMITRPGLELEFDTGVEECIDGLTEDDGATVGGSLLMFGGVSQGAGANKPAFRAVFLDASLSYSEFAFALYGPASATRGVASPSVATGRGSSDNGGLIFSESHPFIFRGQIVMFAHVDRNGTEVMALVGLNLPGRAFLQATGVDDCWTNELGPVGDPLCPGLAGQATPVSTSEPPLWPFQHPVGSANVLVYFNNPFVAPATDTSWRVDNNDITNNGRIDSIIVIPERLDDPLTGTAGVSEVLYFVAFDDTAGPEERRLIRWDGTLQSTEFAAIPDDLYVALGYHAYGPVLASSGAAGSPEDWAAIKTQDGTWSVIGGYGWTLGVAPNYWAAPGPGFVKLVNWGGTAHLIMSGSNDGPIPGTGDAGERHALYPLGATEFSDIPSCTFDPGFVGGQPISIGILDAVVSGHYCYAVGKYFAGPATVFYVGDFLDPSNPVSPIDSAWADPLAPSWIAAIGERVYVGTDYLDPIFDGTFIHDVTDPSAAVLVFGVSAADAPDMRPGLGAIGPPNDDAGGEGFQPN